MPAWLLEIRGRVPAKAGILLGLAPIAALLILWWLATIGPAEERAIGPTILPSPVEVVQSIPDLLARRNLFHHILVSLRRIALGYLLAVGVVLPIAVLMGAFGSVRATFAPLATASGYIPIATLVPLTMSWFGTGELQKVMFLAAAFGIALLPPVAGAIGKVSDVYLLTAYTLGARRRDVVLRVLIPIALPDIWQGLRIAFGVGWTYLVLTEVIVLEEGLGYLVEISQRRGPREHIYLVIVVITLIAWGSDLLWTRAHDRLFPYARGRA